MAGTIWSYSRLKCFEDCKYRFFLKYILGLAESPTFFASYGSFVHYLLAKYYSGKYTKDELTTWYLMLFHTSVEGVAPSSKVFSNYFDDGLWYFQNIGGVPRNIMGVEQKINFQISDKNFVGFVDLITGSDGCIRITDHKSRALRDRSGRKTPTLYDKELDEYLKQLYLYSLAVLNVGELAFNCFRIGNLIVEKFDRSMQKNACEWALKTIEKIELETKWTPTLDYFHCTYLCGLHDKCEYFETNFVGKGN